MLPTSALQLSPPPLHASNCPKRLAVTPKGDPGKPQKGCLMRMASLLFFLPCDTWKLQCVYHDSCELQSIQAYTSGLGHTWWSPHTDRTDSRGWEGVSLNSKKVCMWSGHALRLKWLQVYTHTRAHTRTKYSLNAHTMQTVVPLHPSASLLLLHLHMLSSCTEALAPSWSIITTVHAVVQILQILWHLKLEKSNSKWCKCLSQCTCNNTKFCTTFTVFFSSIYSRYV